jgi:PAS domain-containing protein
VQRYTDELQLLHALSLALLATDTGGAVTFANDAASAIFDRSTGELVGRVVTELVGDATDPDEALPLSAVLEGTGWRGDLTIHRPSADAVVAAVSGTARLR